MVNDLYVCCHGGKRSNRITAQSPPPQIAFCAAVMPRLTFSLGRCNNQRELSRRIINAFSRGKNQARGPQILQPKIQFTSESSDCNAHKRGYRKLTTTSLSSGKRG